MESTITMPDIARLADVTRQAVTNWRARPSTPPFPAVVSTMDGIERFDRDEVVDWLEATGRGHNTDARLDAPAIAFPVNHDLGSAVVLLALRAAIAEDLEPLSADERIAQAVLVDPNDTWLASEVREVAYLDALASYADELLGAAYGPADALDRLYATHAARGVRGLSDDLISLLQTVADAGRTHLGPDAVAIDLRLEPRAWKVAVSFASTSSTDRAMARHLVLDGLTLDPRAASVVRVVSAVGRSDSDALDLADETALDLSEGQVAIVLGPASGLCDRLTGSAYEDRRATLEIGSLVAALRLPRGMWRAAHRQPLGLWVLRGGTAADGVLVADVSGTQADAQELATDVLGALEQTKARAYRYGRAIPYNEVWTRDTVVPPGIGPAASLAARSTSTYDALVEATLVTREAVPGIDVTAARGIGGARSAPRSLGELVSSKAVRLQSGSRFSTDDLDPQGSIRILTAEEGDRAWCIDPLVAADRYPHAVRTEPGDVVFATSPPRAIVDEEGGARVASPGRILRVDPVRAGIGPRALAASINQLATSSEWKTWPVPTVPRDQAEALEETLGQITAHQAELRRREGAATNVINHLLRGVTEGSVTLTAPLKKKAG
jgi:hypothetical protein